MSEIREIANIGVLVRVAYRSGYNLRQSLFRVTCTNESDLYK